MKDPTASRRSLLAAIGTGAAVGLAGCTSGIGLGDGGGDQRTYLSPKDRDFDASALPYPTHGDELPEVTLPEPLRDESVTVPDDFAGRDVVMTFVYTHCMTMCPRLTAILAGAQDDARKQGYGDQVAFVETSFDPARDDGKRFRNWADKHNVEMDDDNWYFLLPESEKRAKSVVQETYGVSFVKTHPEKMDAYMFSHTGLILLANGQGYVERAYKLSTAGSDPVTWKDVADDLATLREREG